MGVPYGLICVAIALALLPVALAINLLALPCLLAYPPKTVSFSRPLLVPMAVWGYMCMGMMYLPLIPFNVGGD